MSDAALQGDQILSFSAGGQLLAIPSRDVAEVFVTPKITRVPQAVGSLQGLANLRGQVVPIISVEALLGGAARHASTRIIVLRGDHPVGLAVDRVCAMQDVGPADDASGAAEVLETNDGPARLLKIAPLLAAAFAPPAPRAATVTDAAPVAMPPIARPEVGFLAFELAGQAFALALEQVREVARVAPEITAVPQADPIAVGVMPLRGELLAVVSLRALLGLPAASTTPRSRVVVARLGAASVGLLVDAVQAIRRVDDSAVGGVPNLLNRGAGEAKIDAIVRTAAGLVSVLATERIFRDETVADIIAEAAAQRRDTDRTGDAAAMEQVVLFRLADEHYGLPIAAVVEVVRRPETIARAPRAPDDVTGIMTHRGAAVPLIDLRRRFGIGAKHAGQPQQVLVVRLGDLTAGLIVDAVEQIVSLPTGTLRPTPDMAKADAPIFDRTATIAVDGGLVLLVDPRQLLHQAERDIIGDVARRERPDIA